MPTQTFKIRYKKNGNLAISAEEMAILYFYGINTRSTDGTKMDLGVYRYYIEAAQQEIERFLGIKLFPTFVEESKGYFHDDYSNGFPIIPTSYPVEKALCLVGMLNELEQIVYPSSWLSVKKNSDVYKERNIYVVPVSRGVTEGNADVILAGLSAQIGLRSFRNIPNYWTIQYTTGFADMPMDVLNIVGKLASIGIFNVLGDIVLGTAAVANYSLSIDGLSQSIGTTNSAENSAFSARIINYIKEIKETLAKIKNNVRGLNFAAL